MAAFSDRQASILSYCRIDDPTPEDLALLEGFHADAVSYMRNAGVAEPEAVPPSAPNTIPAFWRWCWTPGTAGALRPPTRRLQTTRLSGGG